MVVSPLAKVTQLIYIKMLALFMHSIHNCQINNQDDYITYPICLITCSV